MIAFARNDASEDAERTACRCHELPPNTECSATAVEYDQLARELASGFREKVEEYRKYCNLPPQEARQRTAQHSPECIDHILNAPPAEVSWFDLDTLARKDDGLALERWEQIKEVARNEIRSGYRAARAVEDSGGPCERARFLAVRAELTETWQPRNAVEQHLVDQLAQWQVLLWRWQEALSTWTTNATLSPRRAKKGERYETMRLSESEALEGAARKVEQLHRLYLRTLKALRDQRRQSPPVVARYAEQVNIGAVRISVDSLGLPPHSGEGPP